MPIPHEVSQRPHKAVAFALSVVIFARAAARFDTADCVDTIKEVLC